mmetsp:Transcript_36706/g.53938  ORF Transcript_36706/g.53938 Transcript_36706/m.53938 type:complete len:138 (+) Transcript_36706:105-518(+)|eukprot:CAMPEP_0195526586 /NCGR_PEP_ID=MMETSP0794_2-20130614/27750_1 /TAXON_ID=515487 /ORGANISM="Stephanopyxis turris, Strain CCMP 815" /LENGTH=137 /DNA_ID=CAMNT_0040657313 /DNA_START=76 /DNA_END=489 /DNA_ORIENTATION=+
MPESHKAEKRRIQKANRAAGIGDENGRLMREKEPPKMALCTVCQAELKITKTNTELKAHAESKHGKTLDVCFPGAAAIAEQLIAAAGKGKGGSKGGSGGAAGGSALSKKDKKKKYAAGLDDLLSAGLQTTKKKGGKR